MIEPTLEHLSWEAGKTASGTESWDELDKMNQKIEEDINFKGVRYEYEFIEDCPCKDCQSQ